MAQLPVRENDIKYFLPMTQKGFTISGDISLARKLLEQYSNIPAACVDFHIFTILEKASQHPDPYPCITTSHFLQFEGTQHRLFDTILSRLTAPNSTQNFLDIGCCFGQDICMYAYRGPPIQNLYGVDLYPEFLELGYELFNDRARLGGHFYAGNIFAPPGKSTVDLLQGKVDMISATAFLHLFTWVEQVAACFRMISFLKPFNEKDQDQQVIFGKQTASVGPGVRIRDSVDQGRGELFMHDLWTFKKLWKEVGSITGTEWEVKGQLKELPWHGVNGIIDANSARLMEFEVWRKISPQRRQAILASHGPHPQEHQNIKCK
ncbi:hypothetical protein BDZ45DRAFT_113569 [Acephala macrosclerotiorum]|nr:hypothetical protein BDZ45DRAFT_113569 [Acephala macrosclerotiorum]